MGFSRFQREHQEGSLAVPSFLRPCAVLVGRNTETHRQRDDGGASDSVIDSEMDIPVGNRDRYHGVSCSNGMCNIRVATPSFNHLTCSFGFREVRLRNWFTPGSSRNSHNDHVFQGVSMVTEVIDSCSQAGGVPQAMGDHGPTPRRRGSTFLSTRFHRRRSSKRQSRSQLVDRASREPPFSDHTETDHDRGNPKESRRLLRQSRCAVTVQFLQKMQKTVEILQEQLLTDAFRLRSSEDTSIEPSTRLSISRLWYNTKDQPSSR